MAARRIVELRFVDDDAAARAHTALRSAVAAHDGEVVGQVQLGRTNDGHTLLFVDADDADELARYQVGVLDRWLAECKLAVPERTVDVTVLWSGPDTTPEPATDEARRERFIERVVDVGTVWGLYGDTWARAEVGADVEALPFWSSRAEAARCIRGAWTDFVPRPIELEAFVTQWLASMVEDGIVVVVCPGPDEQGALVDPAALIEMLVIGGFVLRV